MSSSLKSLMSLFSANLIVKALGIGSIFVLTRFLTKEELSLIPNTTLITGLALVIANFGLAPVIIKTIPAMLSNNQVAKAHSVTRKCISLTLPVLILISILIYVFSESVSIFLIESENYSLHFKIIAASVAFTGIRNFFASTYWAYDMLKKESKLLVIEGLVKIALNIVLVIYYGSLGLVVSLAVTQVISLSYAIYDLRHILFSKETEKIRLKELLSESLPFQLEALILYFRAHGDQLVVTSFLGAEALAMYFIAKKIYGILKMFARSLDKVFTSSLAKQVGDLAKYNERVSNIFKLNIFIFLPVVAFIIGLTPFAIGVLAGSNYTDASTASILLTISLLINVLNNSTYGRSVFLLKSSMGRFKLSLINSVAILLFSYFGVKFFSIEGVAAASLAAEAVTYFAGYLFIRNEVILNYKVKQIFTVIVISIISAGIIFSAQLLSNSIGILILATLSSLLFYLIAINRSISNAYYSFISTYLPFMFKDPLNLVLSKLHLR